jgi:hypothetical protein
MRVVEGEPPYVLSAEHRLALREASAPAAGLLKVLMGHREPGQRIVVTHEVPAPEPSPAAGRRRVRPWLLGRLWTGNRPRHQ